MIFFPKLNEEQKKWMICLGAISKLHTSNKIECIEYKFIVNSIQNLQSIAWFKDNLLMIEGFESLPEHAREALELFEMGEKIVEDIDKLPRPTQPPELQ